MDKKTIKLLARLTWIGCSRESAIELIETYKSRDRLKDLERAVAGVLKHKSEELAVMMR